MAGWADRLAQGQGENAAQVAVPEYPGRHYHQKVLRKVLRGRCLHCMHNPRNTTHAHTQTHTPLEQECAIFPRSGRHAAAIRPSSVHVALSVRISIACANCAHTPPMTHSNVRARGPTHTRWMACAAARERHAQGLRARGAPCTGTLTDFLALASRRQGQH